MIKKIWRYSHLYLAISSALFLLLAALTGIILAFEPIQTQVKHGHSQNLTTVSLAHLVPKLEKEYDEVFELKRSKDDIILVSALNAEQNIEGEFIIDLNTGKAVTEAPKQSQFFEFITSLHRSLFLKSTGRWLIGTNSFFLFLLAITGLILIIKRQQGFRHFFNKIIRLDFPSYAHTYLGRWMLIPILILSLSAFTLFLMRFEYLPNSQPTTITYSPLPSSETIAIEDFEVFKNYSLADFQSLEFPFSEFEDDYFILTLNDKTLHIHQYTGQIIEETPQDLHTSLNLLSLFLHTGKGSILWAIVLGFSALSILYFLYSGLQMALPRLKRKPKNKFSANEAKTIVLYGSESGNTQHVAYLFFQSLLQAKQEVYITSLNKYQVFPAMERLVIFTSTYGKGEAPHNASYFMEKCKEFKNNQAISYTVVGFGSKQYPKFCAFAQQIETELQSIENFTPALPIQTIDNQSTSSLKSWWKTWNEKNNIHSIIPDKIRKKHHLHSFKVLSKVTIDDGFGTTFLLHIHPQSKLSFKSGDLMGIFPPNEEVERFYSIGKTDKHTFLLSIKLHELGRCSNYLYQLTEGDIFSAYLKTNSHFHIDPKASSVTFISNGTGIAPYLGMIRTYAGEKYFYWGGRNQASWKLYQPYINEKNFKEFTLTFSREEGNAKYIQDLIKTKEATIFERLQTGGMLMFCGSMQMQKDIMQILDNYAKENHLPTMQTWLQRKQIKIDTY